MAKKDKCPNRTEDVNPDKAAMALVDGSTPHNVATFKALAEEAGMPVYLMRSIMKRMEAKYPGPVGEIKRFSHRELVRALDEKIAMALEYLDPYVYATANLRDLSIHLGIMIEKKQLLEGQPTAILGTQERKHINELMPALIREAQRRGITIDVTPDEPARTILPEVPQKEALSATARRFKDKPIDVVLE